ncbi:MAG: class I SAM-dependent methyltransferase [Planctomycetota bacterium]
MKDRADHREARTRYLAHHDEAEVAKHEAWALALDADDHAALRRDLGRALELRPGWSALDAGAGTGALCLALAPLSGLRLTALEPCPKMLARLAAKPALREVRAREGFCDHPDDREHFAPGEFDVVLSRQLVNCLLDPLAAFANWRHWLRPGGHVVVMDGLYRREDWGGSWADEVDRLPMSVVGTTALVPYLLERSGFRVEHAGLMVETNARSSVRTPRYLVVATRDD